MTSEHEQQGHGGAHDPVQDDASISITVVHEDSGQEETFRAGPGTPVGTIIDRAYSKFGMTRNDGDRLRVETTGDSVFGHERDHLGAFVTAEGGCVVWLLAGPTGGA